MKTSRRIGFGFAAVVVAVITSFAGATAASADVKIDNAGPGGNHYSGSGAVTMCYTPSGQKVC